MKDHFLHTDTMMVMTALFPVTEVLDAAAAHIVDWARAKNLMHRKLPGGWQVQANEQRWTLALKKQPVFAGEWVDEKAHTDNHTFAGWRNGLALEIAQLARDLTDDVWLAQMDVLDKGT